MPRRHRVLRRALRRPRGLGWLLAAALVVVAAVGIVVAGREAPTPSAAASSSTVDAADASASFPVAVIGDSISAGTPLGGRGSANWTAVLGAEKHWNVTDTAVGGTGYVNPGAAAPFRAAQLERALATGPRVVIVQGSRNDIGLPVDRIRDAAGELYRDVRTRLPGARLVVVGPFWDAGSSLKAFAVRDALAAAARAAGATFVDPMAEGWFVDAYDGGPLIGSDGVHPTDAGHALYARRLGADLDRLGV